MFELKRLILEQLQNNQFLSGGVMLGALTSVLYAMKGIPMLVWERIRRRIRYAVIVEQDSDLYNCVQDWTADHHQGQLKTPKAIYTFAHQDTPDADANRLKFQQHNDFFLIWKSGRLIRISTESERLGNASSSFNAFYRKFEISGLFAKAPINRILKEAVAYAEEKRKNRKEPKLFKKDSYNSWTSYETVFKSPDSIFLPLGIKEKLITDLENFYTTKSFYMERSIPYRRGYCLYGPPGTGKTSLVSAMAFKFKRDLCVMNLNNFQADDKFEELMSEVPTGAILLIEDIDSFFQGRESKTKVSFSSFINAISGVASKHDVVVFITTNNIEALDPALIRAGRMDMTLEIPNPTLEEVNKYLSFFYNTDIKLTAIKGNPCMADVENICIQNKDDKENTLRCLSGQQ